MSAPAAEVTIQNLNLKKQDKFKLQWQQQLGVINDSEIMNFLDAGTNKKKKTSNCERAKSKKLNRQVATATITN